jgi:hypothetical protein
MRCIAAVALVALGCGGAGSRLRFGETDEFALEFEEQHVRPASVIAAKQGGREIGPSGSMIALEKGDKVVLWCYHFEKRGTGVLDHDRAFTLAIEIDALTEGRRPVTRAVLYGDHWSGRDTAVQVEATGGWVAIDDVTADRVEARYEIELKGARIERGGGKPPIEGRMRGRLSLRRS